LGVGFFYNNPGCAQLAPGQAWLAGWHDAAFKHHTAASQLQLSASEPHGSRCYAVQGQAKRHQTWLVTAFCCCCLISPSFFYWSLSVYLR